MHKFTAALLSSALALSLSTPAFAMGMEGKSVMRRDKMTTNVKMMKKTMRSCLSKRELNSGSCKERFRQNSTSNRVRAHAMIKNCANLYGTEKAACLMKQRGEWGKSSSEASSSSASSEGSSSSAASSSN